VSSTLTEVRTKHTGSHSNFASMKIETEMVKSNNDDQISSSSAKSITADESERNVVRQDPCSGDDSCDDEYATDVESEVAAVNNDVDNKVSSKIDKDEEECATTVSSSKSISSNSRNKDDVRQQKKLSQFRQPRHFCFSSSCSDLNAYIKPTPKTSFTEAELAAKKVR
jgi:hypothetical protein